MTTAVLLRQTLLSERKKKKREREREREMIYQKVVKNSRLSRI